MIITTGLRERKPSLPQIMTYDLSLGQTLEQHPSQVQ